MRLESIHKFRMPYQYKVKGVNWVLNRATGCLENFWVRKIPIQKHIRENREKENLTIVSLTTYPQREKKVQWTLKTLFNQTAEIDKIILWLSEEQYPEKKIPDEIKQYMDFGLEVRFCEELRSHKKYYYTMMENPQAIVVTVDDDVLYPEDTIEHLLTKHQRFPNAVVCNQARLIQSENGEFLPYRDWGVNISPNIDGPDMRILPIGEGGILYPPGCLHEEVFNRQLIKDIALYADDLWLKTMAMKNGTMAVLSTKTQTPPCGVIEKNTHDEPLNKMNIGKNRNDITFKLLREKFPEAFELLLT